MSYKPWEETTPSNPSNDPFEDLIRGFFVRPMGFDPRTWSNAAPFKVDVTENERGYEVLAELPGVKKEDIGVTIDGATVTISAEVKREREAGGQEERTLWSERYHGKLQRAFTLGHEIDQEKASARYTDGVLALTLPKSESSMGKRLTVH